jgi:hypothetical protein
MHIRITTQENCYRGILSPNNQYNIYQNKYSRLSKLSFFPCLIQRLNLLTVSQEQPLRFVQPLPKYPN